jgi:hypothetical protein
MNFVPSVPLPTPLKLESFRHLPIGWHYGKGGPLSKEVVDKAVQIYNHLLFLGFTRTNAFAGAGGEAQIAVYHREHHIAITIEPNLLFGLEHEVDGKEALCHENLRFNELKSKLRAIADEIWSTSGSSTQRISTKSPDISAILNSRENIPMDQACRWYSVNAPLRKVAG